MKRIRPFISRLLRYLAMLPYRLMPRRWQIEALEKLVDSAHVVTATPRGAVRFHCPSLLLVSRAEGMLMKEPDTLEWINGMADGSVFWDVGANVGLFSLYAALNPKMSVLSFEPAAGNYQVLCRNIEINRFSNVNAYCLAFSRESRLGVLNMTSSVTGTALNQFGDVGDMSRYAERSSANTFQGMIGFGIDDFIARFSPPFPNHLKIDVDGLEWPILMGARDTLRDPRLESLMAELPVSDPCELDEIIQFLGQCGFIVSRKGAVQTAAGEEGCNHIFVRAE